MAELLAAADSPLVEASVEAPGAAADPCYPPIADRLVESERHAPVAGYVGPYLPGDPGRWTTPDPDPVTVAPPAAGDARWLPICDAGTDPSGWRYATAFSSFKRERSGGRAAARPSDRVRRRAWQWHRYYSAEEAAAAAATRAAPETPPARLGAAFSALAGLLGKAARRRGLSIPIDPLAPLRLRASHDAERAAAARANAAASPLPATALGRLAVAALHCCAAYGYPMARGWLESVHAGAATFTWRRLRYDAADGVDAASHSAAARSIVGDGFELLAARWRATENGPAYYVGLDHALKWVVVSVRDQCLLRPATEVLLLLRPPRCHCCAAAAAAAAAAALPAHSFSSQVRGTLTAGDLLTDLCASATRHRRGLAHCGVVRSAESLLRSVAPALGVALEVHPEYEVVFVGHSLGGAVATVAANLARRAAGGAGGGGGSGSGSDGDGDGDGDDHDHNHDDRGTAASLPPQCARATCVSVGQIASVSEALLGEYAGWATAVVLGEDPVPRLSMASVDGLLDELCDATTFRIFMASLQGTGGSGSGSGSGSSAGAAPAHNDLPMSDLAGDQVDDDDGGDHDWVQLYPAGAIVQVDDDGPAVAEDTDAVAVAADVPAAEYAKLRLSWGLMGYHVPQRYLRSLVQACDDATSNELRAAADAAAGPVVGNAAWAESQLRLADYWRRIGPLKQQS